MANSQRTWITREEIAQIVDARCKKVVDRLSRDGGYTVLDSMIAGQDVLRLQTQAATIRANDKLFSNRVGERV